MSDGAAPTSRRASAAREASRSALAWGLWVVAAVVLGIGAATARVVWSGEAEIATSTAALRAGDAHGATVHARRAAGWYAPGAPHVRVAYERLVALATTAEGLGDRETATFAWEAIRSASLETRWLVTPHEADLARANRAIAKLQAAAPRPPGTRTEPSSAIERAQLEALLRDEAPRVHWIVALALGLSAWAGGAVWIVRRGVDATGHLARRAATPGLLVAAAGVALWLAAIWRA